MNAKFSPRYFRDKEIEAYKETDLLRLNNEWKGSYTRAKFPASTLVPFKAF